MNFEEAIYNQLNGMQGPFTIRQSRLFSMLSNPATPKSMAVVARLEHNVRTEMGIPQTAAVDWSTMPPTVAGMQTKIKTIDWVSILALIEQWLPELLAFFGITIP